MATYARLKAEFEEIVAVEKRYSPGEVMAPIKDEEMAPEGWDPLVSCTMLKNCFP